MPVTIVAQLGAMLIRVMILIVNNAMSVTISTSAISVQRGAMSILVM